MNIGVWGDSITYGTGDSEALGWVGRVRHSLGVEHRVHNRGIGGDTSKGLLVRFDVEVEAIEPDTIVFAVGINDSKFPAGSEVNKVPLEEYKQNIHILLAAAQKHTKRIIIVGLTKVDEAANLSPSRFLNSQIEMYNSFLKEFAENNILPFIDVYESLDTTTDLCDGLHPNAQGYDKLSKVILGAII